MQNEHTHIVKKFDQEIDELNQTLAEMTGLVESQLENAMQALIKQDNALAQSVVTTDYQIDDLNIKLELLVMRLFALRHPVAKDLRQGLACLKASNDLERMGDNAKNIAKRAMTLSQLPVPSQSILHSLDRMAVMVRGMLHKSLEAYLSWDKEKSGDILAKDEDVDLLYTSLFRELLTYMMEDPRNITYCTHLIFIAKNLERIGDHVTNVAEYVFFILEGEGPEGYRPKADGSMEQIVDVPEDVAQIYEKQDK